MKNLIPTILILCLSGISSAAEKLRFEHEIRPLLSKTCFFCHGPDEKHQKGDLRLDTHEGLLSMIKPGNR